MAADTEPYPVLVPMLGGDDPTGTMSPAHVETQEDQEYFSLVDDTPPVKRHPGPGDCDLSRAE